MRNRLMSLAACVAYTVGYFVGKRSTKKELDRLSNAELAERLGVSEATVRKMRDVD